MSGVIGELTENLGGTTYDVAGFRVDAGNDFGNGFSFAGRYELLEGDVPYSYSSYVPGLGQVAQLRNIDVESEELRLLMNYEREVSQGLSVFGGVGYGWQRHEATMAGSPLLKVSGNGVLLNVGANYQSGSIFGSLVYTHALTVNSKLTSIAGPIQGEDEDLGFVELTTGYNINEQLAATLAIETQVLGDTVIEEDWTAALGLKYDF
ncbi:MAG: hypothetical protein EAZ65_03165 [Verrucomicrobia bacterium]|nr:MAG: hypothetical protein EAZ82_03850 [Verrucomicrobiota bacterium]TAF26833.1 MAG: hypothetical protein EAZ71_03160 [Verrucomicrobiota bacterium]TAF42091.1 MAG: hypothetical protein EAZ65_03165 [Verrucomicrobiota bacterium]